MTKRRCDTWQNANSAVRMCHSALRFPTHTDVQTEHGSPTLEELRQLLTVLPREFTLALVAFAPVRLQEPFDFKRMIKRLLKAVSFSFVIFDSQFVFFNHPKHNPL